MEWPWLIINRSKLRDHRQQIIAKDRVIAGHMADLETMHVTIRQQEAKSAREVFQLSESAKHAVALTAEKQREIASMRTQMAEQKVEFKEQLAALTEERKQLVDWITKGMSGMPVFKELPAEPEPVAEVEKPANPLTEPIESDIAEAIRKVGRHPRAIAKFVEQKNDINFAQEMEVRGVRKVFDEDKAVGEAEAVVSKSA